MKALLLVGGKGTRLRPLTIHSPKSIVPIFNRPFLNYQLDLIKKVPEIDEVILSLNYQPHRIEEVFGDGREAGIKMRYVVEPTPLGTAGGVKFASEGVTDTLVVFNGDVLTQIDLAALLRLHRDRKSRATIVLTPVDNPSAYGLVETDADGNIRRFLEKPKADEITCNTINAGIYVLEPSTFDRIPRDVAWSIERSFFPSFIERGETFIATVYRDYWIDIGTPEKYVQVHRDVMDGKYSAPPFNGRAALAWISPKARIDATASIKGPVFIDDDCEIGADVRIGPYTVLGQGCRVETGAQVTGAIIWPHVHIGDHADIRDTIVGRSSRIGANATLAKGILGDRTDLADYTRL
ncbi:MAG TPA: NDP-sugar synthase [Nitrospirales bacterium]|nr:NDP-sugar synthase [Nitrospirales bacterium]